MTPLLIQNQAVALAEAAIAHLLGLATLADFQANLDRVQTLARQVLVARGPTVAAAGDAPVAEAVLQDRLRALQAQGLGGALNASKTTTLACASRVPDGESLSHRLERAANAVESLLDSSLENDPLNHYDELGWLRDRSVSQADRQVLAAAYRSLRLCLDALDLAKGAALPGALQNAVTMQSALRTLLSREPYWHCCPLQVMAFVQLRALADTHQIFVPRHMRANDPADPRKLQETALAHTAATRRRSDDDKPSLVTVPPPRQADPVVTAACDLLKGKRVLLIGGDEYEHRSTALAKGLQLDELRWLPTSPHGAHGPIRQAIMSEGIDVVVFAIRWSSHSFSELAKFARQLGKPVIRLPAGLGLNQVAHQAVTQLSVGGARLA